MFVCGILQFLILCDQERVPHVSKHMGDRMNTECETLVQKMKLEGFQMLWILSAILKIHTCAALLFIATRVFIQNCN